MQAMIWNVHGGECSLISLFFSFTQWECHTTNDLCYRWKLYSIAQYFFYKSFLQQNTFNSILCKQNVTLDFMVLICQFKSIKNCRHVTELNSTPQKNSCMHLLQWLRSECWQLFILTIPMWHASFLIGHSSGKNAPCSTKTSQVNFIFIA